MRCLTAAEANAYLGAVGMQIGDWSEIADTTVQREKIRWTTYQAPTKACELLCFARHIAGWLPAGQWKLFQIDNSTFFDVGESSFVEQLLFGTSSGSDVLRCRTFLFEFNKSDTENRIIDLQIANLIFAFLMFEAHAYITSSGSALGQLLAIQDRAVHFGSRDDSGSGAEILLRRFERDPLAAPTWVMDLVVETQKGKAKGS